MRSNLESVEPRDIIFDLSLASEDMVISPPTVVSPLNITLNASDLFEESVPFPITKAVFDVLNEVAQQQVEIIQLQWDILQLQVDIRLQQWELTQQQVIMALWLLDNITLRVLQQQVLLHLVLQTQLLSLVMVQTLQISLMLLK